MELKTNRQGHAYITIFETETKSEGSYYGRGIQVYIEPERFNIFAWTAGDVVKDMYDDFDLEEWLFVRLEDGRALMNLCCKDAGIEPPKGDYSPYMVLDALYRIYEGQDDAFERLKHLMKHNKFPHQFQFYA